MTRLSTWMAAAVVVCAVGCNEQLDPIGDGTAKYGENWGAWCRRLNCDPSAPEWQNGLINGHQVRGVETCVVDTGYPGDGAALCPPNPGEGMQLHFGPSDYTDADDVAQFLLGPMQEDERCQYVRTTNTEPQYINQYAGRMRPQSHHMILWGPVGTDHPEGLGDCRAATGLTSGFLTGSQTASVDVPDVRGARDLSRGQAVNRNEPTTLTALDLHFVNRSTETILMEGWMNLYTTEPQPDDEVLSPIMLIAYGFQVPPNTAGNTYEYSCPVPQNMRVQLLSGHHHEHSPRFSIWVQRAGSTDRELVYENLDALDPFMATYANSLDLPTPQRDLGISGGKGGELFLNEGDRLVWECEFNNPYNTPVTFGETSTDQMCNVFGAFVADGDDAWSVASIGPASTNCFAGALADAFRP